MLPSMAKKKQREREERYRRHGVDRPESPQREMKAAEPDEAPAKGKGAGKAKAKSRSSAPRGRKPVAFPTLRRSLVRAPIFGIMWFAISRLLLGKSGHSINQDAFQALILTVAMVPLLYFADKVTYTLAKRRNQPVAEPGPDGWLGFKR